MGKLLPVVEEGEAGENLMGPPGKGAEHEGGFVRVGGFVQDAGVEHDSGVGAEYRGRGVQGMNGTRFFKSEAGDVCRGRLAGVEPFVDMGRDNFKLQVDLLQESATAWGGGGEEEHRVRSLLSGQFTFG